MWPRDIEFMLACWLAVSPFVFQHPGGETLWWINDFTCATAIAAAALLSYWRPTRYAHLATLLISFWLVAFGPFGAEMPLPPALQNSMVIGFLLMMTSIIPNEAARPPRAWRAVESPSGLRGPGGMPTSE